MKKITAFLMALVLACGLQMAVGEEEVQLDRLTMSGTTTVTMDVNSARDTYIVIIPSRVEIDPVTQYGEGVITLKSGWSLISINGLDVKLTAAENGIQSGNTPDSKPCDVTDSRYQNFTMKSASGESVTYAIKASNINWPFTANQYCGSYTYNSLISIDKGGDNTEDKTCTLTFYVATMPPAGVYTDTLTFSIITR